MSCKDEVALRDVIPPEVIEVSPANNSSNVGKDVVIEVTFSEPIDQNSINEESVRLLFEENEIDGSLTYDNQFHKLIFTPTQMLNFYTQYVVELSADISDTAQNTVESMTWSFMTLPELEPASYEVAFTAAWSAETHPIDFPSNPHFSGLIGMTHSEDTILFRPGKLASTGIKDMAERGSKSALISEMEQMIVTGSAHHIISGGGINPSPSQVTLKFNVELPHSLVSIVTMIAPSPDWFVAAEGVNLYKDGKWVSDSTVFVKSYDSGTDNGSTFTSANEATNPFVPIFEINSPPLATNGTVVPLGSMKFTRIAD